MLNRVFHLLGEEASAFIEEVIPDLLHLPYSFSFFLPLLHLLLYAFDCDDLDCVSLGQKILKDKDSATKIRIVFEGISKILKDLHAENDGKEDLVNKDS